MKNPSLLSSEIFITIIIFIFTPTVFPFSTKTISYSDHCTSFAPEAIPTDQVFTRYPFLEPVTSHYTGGQRILGRGSLSQRSILFRATRNLFKTNIIDTYKIQARLQLVSSNIYHTVYDGQSNYSQVDWMYRRPLVFYLDGFWSVSTNKLCMVGSGRWFSKEGNPLQLDVVLKLNFARYITLNTSLVSGILESLASPDDSNYFEPIAMLGFPRVAPFKYNYTLVSNEECNGGNTQQHSATSMQSIDICSSFTNRFRTYQLEYPSSCSSTQNCTLFDHGSGYLPSFVSLYAIQCSWNGAKDELCIVACQILNQSNPMGGAHVGDCSIRLTLWYPAVRSIKNTHTTEGQIWTTKTADDFGYFETIKLQSFDHSLENYGPKYEFTQMEKVGRFCPTKKHAKREGDKYPSGYHQDMVFDMSVKHKNMASTGFASPVFVGNRFYDSYTTLHSNLSRWQAALPPMATSSTTSYNGPLNVSYEISFTLNIGSTSRSGISSLNLSSTNNGRVEISAEGFYDDETGQLCMVGCRKLHSFGKNSRNASFDCDILVRFQLPRTNGDNGSFIKGSIESLRKKTDVMYFEHLDVFSLTYTATAARKSIWRMDIEIIMVLISDTLACVFIGRQLFHVKKRPEMVPFISVLMMLILALGHMIPLVLNFEAMFSNTRDQKNIPLGTNGGLLEVNEVIVRIVTMIAFILQFHLLQLTWTAKLSNDDGNGKNPWIPEMRTLIICLAMYIVGGSVTLLVNWKNNNYTIASKVSIWGDLKSYGGLTLDGFLLPQLILNIFQISKGNALSHSFYIGTTFVRLLPHAYDLYRGPKNISHQFDRFYIYANPRADFYSPSWDVVIACGGIGFAVIIFLQQLFGGRFMFPKRFQEAVEYEMVPKCNVNCKQEQASIIMVKSSSRLPYSLMVLLLLTTCSIASASSSPVIKFLADSGVSEALPNVLEQTSEPFAEETNQGDEKKSAVIKNIYKRNTTGVYKIEGFLTEIKTSGFYHLPTNSTSSKKVKESSTIDGGNDEKQTRLGNNLFIGFWVFFGLNYLLWISIGL